MDNYDSSHSDGAMNKNEEWEVPRSLSSEMCWVERRDESLNWVRLYEKSIEEVE